MRRYRSLLLILLLAFAVRAYNIGSPPIGVHQWRQSQTAMVARNYFENGYRFMYPQIDWAGATPGYAETDFPIYSYAVALGYGVLGDKDYAGRLTSIIFSLITIVLLYLLAKKHTDEGTALWAALFYSILPLVAFYGRAVMPEPLMIMGTVGGIYFFSLWLDSRATTHLALSFILVSVACLLKPTSLYMGLPLLFLVWRRFGPDVWKKPVLWSYSAAVVTVVFAWYYHAHNIYLATGQTIGLYDKWLNWDLIITAAFWRRVLLQSLFGRHFALFGFPLFIAGLFIKRRSPQEPLFDYWVLSVVIYILIAGQGNFVHDYYQLVFMPPAAVFMGKACSRNLTNGRGWVKALIILCLAGFFAASAVQYRAFMKQENPLSSPSLSLSGYLKSHTPEKSLIIAVTNGDPAVLYLSHRKGWVVSTYEIDDSYMQKRISQGAEYIAGVYWKFDKEADKKDLERILANPAYKVVYDDKSSFVVKLRN